MSAIAPRPYRVWLRRALAATGISLAAAFGFAVFGLGEGLASNHQGSHALFVMAWIAAGLFIVSFLATVTLAILSWRQERAFPRFVLWAFGVGLLAFGAIWWFLGAPGMPR